MASVDCDHITNIMMYRVKQYSSLPPPYGGVSVFIKRLTFALHKKGWISGAFFSNTCDGIPGEIVNYMDRFPRHSRSILIIPDVRYLIKVFKNYDLVHSHMSLLSCFSTWVIHKLLRLPVVYTIHNQMLDKEFDRMNFLDRYCLKSLAADETVQFISVNRNIARMLIERGVQFRNPLEVIPAYIPPVEYGTISDYLSPSLINFIDGDDPFILFYAESLAKYNNAEIYGITDAIEAFVKVKDEFPNLKIVLCITNYVDDNDLDRYKGKLNKYTDSVYWQTGPMSEMWPLLKSATLLLRPTSTDGDSVMIREALAYGLPVVASDVVKRPHGCYTYEYGNRKDLVDKIASVLLHPQRNTISQEDYTDSIIQIYSNLLVKNN